MRMAAVPSQVSTAALATTAAIGVVCALAGTALSASTAAGVRLWAGSPGAVDVDSLRAMPVAAVVARAAVLTWLGTPAIRTRHVLPVRRAIDMTSSIAGTRLPSLTTRGLG